MCMRPAIVSLGSRQYLSFPWPSKWRDKDAVCFFFFPKPLSIALQVPALFFFAFSLDLIKLPQKLFWTCWTVLKWHYNIGRFDGWFWFCEIYSRWFTSPRFIVSVIQILKHC
jgi:hypothetical protein